MTDTELLNWLEKQYGAALINDDIGHWAVATQGLQNCPLGEGTFDLASTWWVEKHAFYPTIREAIRAAIENENVHGS